MRKYFAMIVCAATITASAQEDFNRAKLEFLPSTLSYHGENADMGKLSMTGGSLGYEHGFSLSDYYECYIVAGAKIQYLYKSKVRPYKIETAFVDTRITDRLLDINIPVSFMYHFQLSDNIAIEPFAGVNATCYLMGQEKLELAHIFDETINYFDKSEMQDYYMDEAYKRLHVGWHAGADLVISEAFSVGLTYGTDFTDFGNDAHWTHWSLGVGFAF